VAYSWPRASPPPSPRGPHVVETPLFERVGSGVRCLVCRRRCMLREGTWGLCKNRFAKGGKLYVATYGLLSAAESRPMEIKPMYHFYPRTSALTISGWGCNFPCAWCQNWHLSKVVMYSGVYTPPERIVEWALENGDSGINVSFNEPTMLLEYTVDVFKRAAGLHKTINTNGYLTREALDALIAAGMEGANVDLKGGPETYRRWLAADFHGVVDTIQYLWGRGVHVEVTYLVIPGVNDHEADDVVEAVAKVDRSIPLHITAFHPAHLMPHVPPTPVQLLEEIWQRARKELDYVYVGNVPGHKAQHTYCPKCGALLIKRFADRVVEVKLDGKRCPKCGYEIKIRGHIGHYGNLYRRFI